MACLRVWQGDSTETSWHHCYMEMSQPPPSVQHMWFERNNELIPPQEHCASLGLMRKVTFSKAENVTC